MATRAQTLKRIECAPECGFIVQSHDEREVLSVARTHTYVAHGKDYSLADLRASLRSA